MADPVATHLSRNLKQLRESRNLTQNQMARLAEVPRPTVANLESGEANPSLSLLVKLAAALQVSVESLISPPRATTKFYGSRTLFEKKRGEVTIRRVLPDTFGALEIDRMDLPPAARMVGMPHKQGTREYLVCESGEIELAVAGENWRLTPGDVAVFRGDQRHSYRNPGARAAVGYSVILVGPTLA